MEERYPCRYIGFAMHFSLGEKKLDLSFGNNSDFCVVQLEIIGKSFNLRPS